MSPFRYGTPVASQVAQLEAYVHETLFTPEGGRRDEYLQVLHEFCVLFFFRHCPPPTVLANIEASYWTRNALHAGGRETGGVSPGKGM